MAVRAAVVSMRMLSPTTKLLTLRVEHAFSFLPGQWIDFTIPDEPVVGGFSICSSPQRLHQEKASLSDSTVKKSSHPPSRWIHEQCAVGSVVDVQAGGDVVLQPDHLWGPAAAQRALFIAGGIGISPLFSMLQHLDCLQRAGQWTGRCALLYSAASAEELLFLSTLHAMARGPLALRLQTFVTQQQPRASPVPRDGGRSPTDGAYTSPVAEGTGQSLHSDCPAEQGNAAVPEQDSQLRRMATSDLREALEHLGEPSSLHVFVCGPPAMADSTMAAVRACLPAVAGIHCEKWW